MTYSFESVIAWQKAHVFVLAVYRITKHYPKEELFGLTSQFRRAAVSIEANIAIDYISTEEFSELRDALEDASRMLYLYCNGIKNNNGIKD